MSNTEQTYTETIAKGFFSSEKEPARGVLQSSYSASALRILVKYLCKGFFFFNIKFQALGIRLY